MAILLKEYPDSRSATSVPQTRTLHCWLSGIHDDAQARAYVSAGTPVMFDGYYRQNIDLVPKGNGLWDVEVPYGAVDSDSAAGSVSFTFDTTGGSAHITQAKQHVASHVLNGNPPNHNGAINVTDSGPEGTDITVSQFSWVENWTLPIVYASFAVAMLNKAVTGKINSNAFRGFPAGQVKFDGAVISASSQDPEQATGTYKFTQSDDSYDAMPAFKAGITKKGWEYIWAEFEKEEDEGAKRIIQPPVAAHVERVYDAADFSILGIGTGLT